MLDKISYELFVEEIPSAEDFSEKMLETWKIRQKYSTFISHMSDVWNEAKQCVDLKSSNNIDGLNSHIEVFINCINCVFTDDKVSKGAKAELREAEWELLDFCIWNNEWHNTSESVMGWFNQWIFDYNYDLI